MASLSLPSLYARKHFFQYALLAGVFTIILLGASYHRSNSSDFHEFAHGSDRSSEVLVEETTLLDHVFNSTLGFEKLLVVGLPERTDHRDRLILQAALSDLKIEFVDGINGSAVSDKALPADHGQLQTTEIGSWRAHMNAIEQVVLNNMGSALVMEDDVDWDIRIKPLLKNFAISAEALVAADPESNTFFHDLQKPPSKPPTITPYGDNWDLLWLGHCGSSLPAKKVIQLDDDSVPEPRYLRSWLDGELTPLSIFPNHTRVVTQHASLVCSLAYAVSQRGARKLLYELGLDKLSLPFDLMLRDFCSDPQRGVCISALPQLFDHHRVKGPKNRESDIGVKEGYRDDALTNNVRLSVAMNIPKLLDGSDCEDQYPDTP